MTEPVSLMKTNDNFEIKLDDLSGEAVKKLLQIHLENAAKHSPEEAIFALDLDALKLPEISFWTVWENDQILACGALKQLNKNHAEIKSMHTLEKSRGKGVASKLLSHILKQAQLKDISQISLETGTAIAYSSAHRLYKKFGFSECQPFDDYEESPHSLYMTLELM